MPELPEVEALARDLSARTAGLAVSRIEVIAFSALKTFDPQPDALVGRRVKGWTRRGKFIAMEVDGDEPLWLAVHLARGGWISWRDELSKATVKRGKGPLALRIGFDSGAGIDITEAGTEKRLAAYVVRRLEDVEHIATLGLDPLDPEFEVATMSRLFAGESGQIKKVLTDQSVIAGVGNAYSDEALHVAKLSPFRKASSLTGEEVATLHQAVVSVLRDAVERSDGLAAAELKREKKSAMRVHGRTGEPCPECGDTIREVSFSTKSLQYCPTCQTGGKPLADRRMSRLLK